MEHIFNSGSVPIAVVARIYGKDKSWLRAGIINGYLTIGIATRDGAQVTDYEKIGGGRINYYISPKKLYDETGYIWRGEKE